MKGMLVTRCDRSFLQDAILTSIDNLPYQQYNQIEASIYFMDISLTPEIEQFIHDRVKSGRYLSASEVVREGLRLLNEREFYYQARLAQLQKEITIGVEQADRGELLDGEAVMQELMQELDCSSTAKP